MLSRRISVHLPPDVEAAVRDAARRKGITMSEYVRQAVEVALSKDSDQPSAWELGKNVFGKYSSGRCDLSTNVSQIARKKIHERAREQREK